MVANTRKFIFYEATWRSEMEGDKGSTVRGIHPEHVVEELLSITNDNSGMVEVFKITFNGSGYSVKLHRKLRVLSDLKLF